jgi:hypothetical protein
MLLSFLGVSKYSLHLQSDLRYPSSVDSSYPFAVLISSLFTNGCKLRINLEYQINVRNMGLAIARKRFLNPFNTENGV